MAVNNIDDAVKYLRQRKTQLENLLAEFGVSVNHDEKQVVLFDTKCEKLKELKVAAVMDAFTLGNFKYECNLFQLTCANWKEEIDEFRPDLLFIESAWNGKDNTWYKKIANGSKDLYDMSEYCRAKGIPIVFWNKEDPVFTDVFMSAAACADYVFTTDIDCIEKYKKNLQNDKVFLLHFGAQPVIHNPVEMHERKDKFCFAGAYYHRYKERCRVFDDFADVFDKTKGFEIFDRNYKNARPEHAFPQRYHNMILGNLPPSEIHVAYKGYNYGVNMNSVNQSQSMFARRVFELLASNTVTVGNYSRGQRNFFGDLTISTDSAEQLKHHLDRYCRDCATMRKFRLAGLRKVLSEHLCEDRLGYIAKTVFGKDMKKPLPEPVIYSRCVNRDEIDAVVSMFLSQSYKNARLVIVTDENYAPDDGRISVMSVSDAEKTPVGGDFAGTMLACDYYGENYLFDLVLTSRYSKAPGFGKAYRYKNGESGVTLSGADLAYRPCDELESRAAIIKTKLLDFTVSDMASGVTVKDKEFFCIDEFNYCENGYSAEHETVNDMFIPDKGLSMRELEMCAEHIETHSGSDISLTIPAADIYSICNKTTHKKIAYVFSDEKFGVESKLGADEVFYTEFAKNIRISDFDIDNNVSVLCSGAGSLSISIYCEFRDAARKKISSVTSDECLYLSSDIPPECEYISLAFRIKGAGSSILTDIKLGSNINIYENMPFVSRGETLVLAGAYPSYDDLYKYMFVHRRVKAYKDRGFTCDVMSVAMDNQNRFREYDSIDIVDGQADRLVSILENGRIKNVFVHFLNPYIWSILKPYTDSINLFVWSHGYDIQPWWRRKYNFETEKEIESAKILSAERENMWQDVFKTAQKDNIHFIFVSEYLRDAVFEDYSVNIPEDKYSVIHNCIDSDLYTYTPKDAQQRFSVLAIKSFDNNNYANDVMAKAIVELSREPEFKNITFDIYGDGVKFDDVTAPIKRFKNVNLHRQFLSPYDIAKQHKTHGIFLCTTRMDTQGVSRDEAMSSGLVPVSNAVAAVPEFVPPECGILADAEDYKGIAEGILKLVRNPELFLKMSENSAKHVRMISSADATIPSEIALADSGTEK